jgi:hypothetical protein
MSFDRFMGGAKELFASFTRNPEQRKSEETHLEPSKIDALAKMYVTQKMLPREFLVKLDETRAEEYEEPLRQAITELEQRTEGTRLVFRVNQLDEMLNRGLEREICKAKGIPFIEDVGSRAA